MLPAFLLPLLGGAAAGMGIGALTDEEGFSGDGWWQGLIGGGALGGLGGAAGLLGGGASTIAPATTAGGLGTFSAPGVGALGANSAAASMITPASISGTLGASSIAPSTGGALGLSGVGSESALSMLTPELLKGSAAMGSLPGQTLAGNIFTNTPGLFGGLEDMMSMPSNDTLMKGLLGSQVFKNMTPQSKPTKSGSINRGQRAAPFQPRQPIMLGGGRPQRRSFRRG
jgi:hypothetical protein